MRASVSDIAQKAGVSPATVSRVLHGGRGVSKEKIASVHRALDASKSMPRMRNCKARMACGNVALLMFDPDDLHSSSIELYRTILHLEAALRARKIELTFCVVNDKSGLPRSVTEGKINALLLAGGDYPPRYKVAIESLPGVWLTTRRDGEGDILMAGNEDMGRMAAEYLLKRGHKNLAYFQIPDDHPVHAIRCEFFEFTAARAKATVQRFSAKAPKFEGPELSDWKHLYECVRQQISVLAASKPRPTGIFISLGMLTGMVYRALGECGLRPGKDVEVVCCDQTMPMLMSLTPRPASIRVDTTAIADRAVEELMAQVEGRQQQSKKVRILIEPQLQKGDVQGDKFGK